MIKKGFRVYTDEKDPVGDYKFCNTFKKHFKGWDKKDDELIYLNDPRIQKYYQSKKLKFEFNFLIFSI
jgi:hypothetical protein